MSIISNFKTSGLIIPRKKSFRGLSSGGEVDPTANPIAEVYGDYDAALVDSYSGSGDDVNTLVGAGPVLSLGDDSGTASTKPTFTGTAGDSGAYFLHDGGDVFTFKTLTTVLRSISREDVSSPITLVFAARFTTGFQYLFGSALADTNGTNIRLSSSGAGSLNTLNRDNGSNVSNNFAASGSYTAVDGVLVIGFDHFNNTGVWSFNSDTGTSFDTTDAGYSGLADNTHLHVMGGNSTNSVPNGTRFYGFSIYKKLFDGADITLVNAMYNARHNNIFSIS